MKHLGIALLLLVFCAGSSAAFADAKEDAKRKATENQFAIERCKMKLQSIIYALDNEKGIPDVRNAFKNTYTTFDDVLANNVGGSGTERYRAVSAVRDRVKDAEAKLTPEKGKKAYPDMKKAIEPGLAELDKALNASMKR